MKDIEDMTFNELTELHKEWGAEIGRLTVLLTDAYKTIEGYSRDKEIADLTQTISHQRDLINQWRRTAGALHDGLILAQMQLSEENIGVRPLARDGIQAYRDMMTA
jgi:hypothetical protein